MPEQVDLTLASRLDAVFALDPAAVAVEFKDERATWGDLAAGAAAVEALLTAAGVSKDAVIGWVARNRPAMVASFAGLVRNGRTVAPLRPNQPAAAFASELSDHRFEAVVADEADWSSAAVAAAKAVGTMGIAVSGASPIVTWIVDGLGRVGEGPHRAPMPDVVMERLNSGTTGPPKRIPVSQAVLIPALKAGEGKKGAPEEPLRLKGSPAILLKPFSHAGGLFGLLLALYQARPMVLFEKFEVAAWVDAMTRYRPKTATLVPAMIQMILQADVPREALSSLLAVRAGTAPLDPETQERFEAAYGVPVLIDYGAAEFIGGVAGWSLPDHKMFGTAKRGSVGRAKGDVTLRVVTAEDRAELPAGEVGLLEIRSPRFGADWFRTNDLALIDADGFLFLRGRADDAINRGGFKVLPDEVAAVLRKYPGVRDAAVVGMPDARLGEAPVAALEVAEGVRIEAAELAAFVREHLPAYMVPVRYEIIDALPRTASLKVSRPELKAMLAQPAGA